MTPTLPPHSLEAEQSVLGGLMVNNRAWVDVADQLAAEDFYTRDHQVIWTGIGALMQTGKAVDFVTLSEHFRSLGALGEVGGTAYLATLASDTPSGANVRTYAGIVRKLALQRGLIAAGQDAIASGFSPDGREPSELIDRAEQQLAELRSRGARGAQQARAYGELVEDAEKHLDAASKNRAHLLGLSTGFPVLDRMTKGLRPGQLVIVGARPGMGKTTFAMNVAEHAACAGTGVAVFSMEMSAEELVQRSIASLAGISLDAIRDGSLSNEDWNAYGAESGRLRKLPLWIDDTGALSPLELRARARRLTSKHGIGLIVVDYIQLMAIPGSRENRTNEISEISRSLKALAKELKVPVIALSQLNRGVEGRDNKRPGPADLRESGSIEQDADLILFLYRDEVYHPTAPKNTAELIIGKQRNGPMGTVWLHSQLDRCRFVPGMRPEPSESPAPRQRGFGRAAA